MRPDKNQEKIYVPLIRDFKNQTADLYKKMWINKTADFSGLFIPHVFDDYYSAKTKVFFIGQDTYGWSELEKTYTLSEKDYLVENNKWPKSIDVTLEWTNPYTFWNFVNRLQLAFNGEKYDSLQNLSSSQRKILNQLGWGNIYSLEILETIAKYGEEFNQSFDHSIYSDLLKRTQDISKLKNVIDAFHPDYVVILAWKYVEEWYLDGLDAHFIAEESIDNLLSVYILNNGTKVLWTYHPQALCRKSQNLDELIKIFQDRKKEVRD